MTYLTANQNQSQDKWYYGYLVDDIPQQLPADNANGYTGPFDTEREAWLSLYAEMTDHIDELTARLKVYRRTVELIDYALPVANGGQS